MVECLAMWMEQWWARMQAQSMVLVSVADGGVVTVLMGNYDFATDAMPVPAVANVTLTLSGFTDPQPTNATVEYIDDTHANPYATWRAAGSPLYPTADEIEAEMAASAVLPMQVSVEAAGSGSVRVSVSLQPYAVARVRVVASSQQQQQQQQPSESGRHSVRQAQRIYI